MDTRNSPSADNHANILVNIKVIVSSIMQESAATFLGLSAEPWIAIATFVLAGVTLILAVIALYQSAHAISSQKKWATLQACDRYDNDSLIQKAVEELKAQPFPDSYESRLNAIRLMNYFGSIAIGMQQGFYDTDIAKAHLKTILFRRFGELIKAGSLTREEAESDFPEVLWLMTEWRDFPPHKRRWWRRK